MQYMASCKPSRTASGEVDGACPDSADTDGRIPLSCAIQEGALSVAKLLLGYEDIDADSVDTDGRTPPIIRCRAGGTECSEATSRV